MRVPLIARWPGHIPASQTIAEPAAMTDWMPTSRASPERGFLPTSRSMARTSGRSSRAAASATPTVRSAISSFVRDNSGLGGYREGRWKLKLAVRGGESVYARYDHDDLLFDLESDPGEHDDLAGAMPDMVAELKRGMAEIAAMVDTPGAAPLHFARHIRPGWSPILVRDPDGLGMGPSWSPASRILRVTPSRMRCAAAQTAG